MGNWLESTARRRMLAFTLLALAAALVCLLQLLDRSAAPSMPGRPGPTTGVTPPQTPPSLTPAELQQFYSLERERQHIDETVWAVEVDAERHEDVFIAYWDAARRDPDPLSVLARIPFQELLVGTPRPFRIEAHNVEASLLGDPVELWRTNRWREWLAERRDEGFVLEQMEIRQPRFEPGPPARSHFVLTANARHRERPERWSLRGTLQVEWHSSDPDGTEPLPRVIVASDLELLHRAGPPAFERVLSLPIEPLPGTIFIDPLILNDLDGDGLPEIILGCRNELLWNRGAGSFQRAALHPPLDAPLNTCTLGDFDGDGRIDLLGADRAGLLFWHGAADGRFTSAPTRVWEPASPLPNAFVMTSGDIDSDGDLDLWLAQYKLPYVEGQMPSPYYDANDGFPGHLLRNNGRARFEDHTEVSGLAAKRHRRTYSSSFIDLDDDRNLDLVVVSDFAGVDLHRNDGRGNFIDVTREWVPDPHAFGMAHSFGDYDLDGRLDLFVVGMNSFLAQRLDSLGAGPPEPPAIRAMRARVAYGNRLLFGRERGFVQTPLSDQVAKSGWSWGTASLDFDNDGDLDLCIVNGHLSRETARDYDRRFWLHDIHLADSNHDRVRNAYFQTTIERWHGGGASYGGFEINRFWVNDQGAGFREFAHPLGLALQEDCRNLVASDLDGDGRLDLVLTTFQDWPVARQELIVFRNLSAGGHWCGVQLEGSRGGAAIGSRVILTTPGGRQNRWVVTGDSYRSQSPATAHFGLGASTNILAIEVRWPGGRTSRLNSPAPDRYHRLRAPE